jgi:hypothetical protein
MSDALALALDPIRLNVRDDSMALKAGAERLAL